MSSVEKKAPKIYNKLTDRQIKIINILKSTTTMGMKMKNILFNLKNPPAEKTLCDDLSKLKNGYYRFPRLYKDEGLVFY